MKLLFVCTANVDRSPTGEDLFKDVPGVEALSAGTDETYATVPISKTLIEWADIIFCMEKRHFNKVVRMSPEARNKTVVLGIPDQYYRGQPELVKLIKSKVSLYFHQGQYKDGSGSSGKCSQRDGCRLGIEGGD